MRVEAVLVDGIVPHVAVAAVAAVRVTRAAMMTTTALMAVVAARRVDAGALVAQLAATGTAPVAVVVARPTDRVIVRCAVDVRQRVTTGMAHRVAVVVPVALVAPAILALRAARRRVVDSGAMTISAHAVALEWAVWAARQGCATHERHEVPGLDIGRPSRRRGSFHFPGAWQSSSGRLCWVSRQHLAFS